MLRTLFCLIATSLLSALAPQAWAAASGPVAPVDEHAVVMSSNGLLWRLTDKEWAADARLHAVQPAARGLDDLPTPAAPLGFAAALSLADATPNPALATLVGRTVVVDDLTLNLADLPADHPAADAAADASITPLSSTSPVPEPHPQALMLAGLGAMLVLALRRREVA